jgi:hypothetical protein
MEHQSIRWTQEDEESGHDIFGISALHRLDPAGMVMALEEHDLDEHLLAERSALRAEIFCGFLEYLFAEGPAPDAVRERIEGFIFSYSPELGLQIKGEKQWISAMVADGVLTQPKYRQRLQECQAAATSRGALFAWVRELSKERDTYCVDQTLMALATLMASEGKTWKACTAVAYCVAKSLSPHLIAGMSLHDIAILSGDAGGRATPSDRARRIINRRLAAGGAKACSVHFQKRDETVKKYSTAQLGNKNRAKSKKRKTNKKRK